MRGPHIFVALSAVAALLAGCGSGTQVCMPTAPVLAVSPQSASADHDAGVPGNQVHFRATSAPGSSPGCPTPQNVQLLTPLWTTTDSHDVSISSAPDATNGLAICLGPTAGPVTLTAHIASGTGTVLINASLFCY